MRNVLLSALLVAGCAPAPVASVGPSRASVDLSVDDVSVIDTETGKVLAHRTVLVDSGRIVAVQAAGTVALARQHIDGSGRYLMPALADMHVHLRHESHLPRYVEDGVTLVREMWGSPKRLAWREQAKGEPRWPTVIVGSPAIDGSPATFEDEPSAATPEQARALVDDFVDQGYDFVKIYDRLDAETLAAILDETKGTGLKVAGHAPFAVPIRTTLTSGLSSLEHGQLYLFEYLADVSMPDGPFQPQTHFPALMQSAGQALAETGSIDRLFDADKRKAFAAEVAASGVWTTPTLVALINTNTPSQERAALLRRPDIASLDAKTLDAWGEGNFRFKMFGDPQLVMLREFGRAFFPFLVDLDRAGGRLLVGTDAPEAFVVPGSSIHEEMAYLVAAGLTPARVLKAATFDAASFLGRDDWGRIAPGAEADFVLLSANPIENIAATKSVVGVANDGTWMPRD